MAKRGRPPAPPTVAASTRLPVALYDELVRLARAERISVARLMRQQIAIVVLNKSGFGRSRVA